MAGQLRPESDIYARPTVAILVGLHVGQFNVVSKPRYQQTHCAARKVGPPSEHWLNNLTSFP